MLLLLGYHKYLAAISINVQVLTWICVFISLWYIPWNKKAEYCDNSIFNFSENCQIFPKQPHFSTFSPAVYEASNISTPSPTVTISLFDNSYPEEGCETQHHAVVLLCISLMVSDTEHLFMCSLAILYNVWRTAYFRPLSNF